MVARIKTAIAWMILVAIIALCTYGFLAAHEAQEESHRACLLAGYPEMTKKDGQYFCWRTVDGTDEVRPVEDLE